MATDFCLKETEVRVVSSSLELDIHRVWIQKSGGKCLSDRSHCTEIKGGGGVGVCTRYSKLD